MATNVLTHKTKAARDELATKDELLNLLKKRLDEVKSRAFLIDIIRLTRLCPSSKSRCRCNTENCIECWSRVAKDNNAK